MRTAFREWRVRWDTKDDVPVLQSTFMPCLWDDSHLVADQLPEGEIGTTSYGSLHGVHACLPWCQTNFLSSRHPSEMVRLVVFGAVDLIGRVVEHNDGVCRAEEVRILALRAVDMTIDTRCPHSDFLVVQGFLCGMSSGNEDRRYAALRRRCLHEYEWGCNGWFKKHGVNDAVLQEVDALYTEVSVMARLRIVRLGLELEQLTHLLCQRYEVPRLDECEGPWRPPLGAGPEPEPSSTFESLTT